MFTSITISDMRLQVWTLLGLISLMASVSFQLSCYECSDSFKTAWEPLDCQINVSAVPNRTCNDQQGYCFVNRVTVKGIPIKIVRDCASECLNGCEATGFGITQISCTSCCATDDCNTGNTGSSIWSYRLRLELASLCLVACCLSWNVI